MQAISKQEMEFLLSKNILKISKGKIDGLVVTSKRKKHDGKTRYVTDPIYNQLLRLQEKLKVENKA